MHIDYRLLNLKSDVNLSIMPEMTHIYEDL